MLVLSRKESQTIVIGEDIEVTIVALQGGRVKLAINAPRHVPIRRAELSASSGDPQAPAALTSALAELDPQLALA